MAVDQSFKSARAVVFDWDGTVLDTTAAIAVSIQYACEKLGLPVPSTAKVKSVIGLGWREAIRIVAPTCPPEEFQAFGAYYVERYRPEEVKVHLFPGIAELIKALHARGTLLAVATGKSRRGLNRILEQTGLGSYFYDTQTAEENPSKPDPAMLKQIGINTGLGPESVVMVGDTTHDIQMAKNWGCRVIAVSYGAMTVKMLEEAHPDLIVNDVGALARALGVEL